MILGLVCFFIQQTKVQSSDLATDILGAVLDKSKQNKLELQKWNLPKKDLVGLKSKEIKSLLSGNFILSEWNDNEIKGRAEDIFYEDGTYEAVVSGERIDSGKKVSLKEKGTWSAKQGKLCFKGIETVNNEEFDYSGCVKVLKSKTNPNVYFLRHQGLIYQKFVKIITIKDRIEEEKKAEEKRKEEEKSKEEEEKRKAEELTFSKEPLIASDDDWYKFEHELEKTYGRGINIFVKTDFDEYTFRFKCETNKRPSDPNKIYVKKYYAYVFNYPSAHDSVRLRFEHLRSDKKTLERGSLNELNQRIGIEILEVKEDVVTFYFGKVKSNPEYIYQADIGNISYDLSAKFTIDQIKPTKKTGRLCVQDKLWEDARKFFNAYHQKKVDKKQKLKAKRKKKEDFNNSPEGQLHNAYLSYLLIKGYYEARKGYAIVYVTSKQMSDSKSQVKKIEETIVAKNKIDSDTIWNKAVKTYEDEEKVWMDGLISSGNFTEGHSQLAKRNLYSLSVIHNYVTGGVKIEKDF